MRYDHFTMLPIIAFRRIGGRMTYEGGGKSDPPPAPDYTGAAVAQGVANKESAIASSRLNNPNVVNPFGTQTWTEGATPDARPTLTQILSPEQQALLDQSNKSKGLLGGLGIQGATALQGVVGKNLDLSGAPAAPTSQGARADAYDAMMTRINEGTTASKDQKNSDLIAAGIRPGTKAYQDAMFGIDRGFNDARQQAMIASGAEGQRDFGMDTQSRKDAIAEILARRQTPLNEINALISGSQVSNPFAVPGAAQNTGIQPAPLYNAANQTGQYQTDVWNQQQANSNGMMGGLFSLGSSALMSPAGTFAAFSDRRLKRNIIRIGTHALGIGLYMWEYLWGEHAEGVMADEVLTVMPEAVLQHPSGYMMVDYGALNHAN